MITNKIDFSRIVRKLLPEHNESWIAFDRSGRKYRIIFRYIYKQQTSGFFILIEYGNMKSITVGDQFLCLNALHRREKKLENFFLQGCVLPKSFQNLIKKTFHKIEDFTNQ